MHRKRPSFVGAYLLLLLILISCTPSPSTDDSAETLRQLSTRSAPTATPFPQVIQTRVPVQPSPTPTRCPLDFLNALFQQPAGLTSFRLDLEQYRLLDDLTTQQSQVISSTQSLIFENQVPVQGDYLLRRIQPNGANLRLIVTDFEAYSRQADAEYAVLTREEGAELLRGTVDSPFLPPELRDPLLEAGCTWERTELGTDSVVKMTFPPINMPSLSAPTTLTGELLTEGERLTYTVWLGTIDTMYLPLQYELVIEASQNQLLVGRMQAPNFIFGVSAPPGFPLPPETDE